VTHLSSVYGVGRRRRQSSRRVTPDAHFPCVLEYGIGDSLVALLSARRGSCESREVAAKLQTNSPLTVHGDRLWDIGVVLAVAYLSWETRLRNSSFTARPSRRAASASFFLPDEQTFRLPAAGCAVRCLRSSEDHDEAPYSSQ
jgi:hypothetical protein